VLVGLYIHYTCATDGRESFGDKHEWSILQSLEALNREKPISDLEFSERAGYHILCAPAANQKRVWIMLDPKSPPFYKQLPRDSYSLSLEQFNRITSTQHVTSTVEECLASHIQ